MKRIPYGISDYKTLKEKNFIFVDKTKYIEKLERYHSPYIFCLRPRRFGKSLFTSMLTYYYDSSKTVDFESLFNDSYIGKNITEECGKYCVLNFTFSGMSGVSKEVLKEAFMERINIGFLDFVNKYDLDMKVINQNATDPAMALNYFFGHVNRKIKHPIFVIIDEYDHFANELLSFQPELFKGLISKTGFVRKWYEILKDWTKEENMVQRIFATGVAPITLDSMTSGFNIGDNITRNELFHDIIGFTADEVQWLVQETAPKELTQAESEKLMTVLKNNYNGYLFSERANIRLFNSDMILYYLKYYVETGMGPKKLIDENIASDYNKIGNLFNLTTKGSSTKIIDKILKGEELIGFIIDQFSLEKDFREDDFLSLLFYLGFLTIDEEVFAEVIFKVPNSVVKGLYFDYFKKKLDEEVECEIDDKDIQASIRNIMRSGEINDFIKVIEKTLNKLSSRDYIAFDEKYIKIVMIAYLNLAKAYLIKSEYEVENGYVDIALLNNYVIKPNYYGIIELKYITKKEYEHHGEALVNLRKEEAIEQINKYKTSEELMKLPNLKKWVLVFVKDECVVNLEIE